MQQTMFCYQCEQTAGGKGCTSRGVCGKTAEVAAMQDLLLYQVKGIAVYAADFVKHGQDVPEKYAVFIEDALFTTLTNVNFDEQAHIAMLKQSQQLKEALRANCPSRADVPQALFDLRCERNDILEDAKRAGIMYDQQLDEDIRSVRETITYGLKGMAAYSHQARVLGYRDARLDQFYYKVLAALTDATLSLQQLIELMLETGLQCVAVMELLDRANTESFASPAPHAVNTKIKKGPLIVVSGHDLYDLELLLEQTQGRGIHIYTHGEMLPAHGYEKLNRYPHLAGNFGTAWQNQQKEFDNLPGCIVMTTNCLMTPQASYRDRIFTTSVVGYEGLVHIPRDGNGKKDFSAVIDKALQLGGFQEDEPAKEIFVGFGHAAVLSHAKTIIDAVKSGEIRRFFLVGGCDGARPGRNYYTDFAQAVPDDCIILTLACGKYRFNQLEFGEVAGLPRLLDVGQCNDAFSAIRIAAALADAFECGINDLPLSMIISWYEQKAVAVLLALLHLGVQNIYLGPVLPAFLSPNVLQFLVQHYQIKHITTPQEDLRQILQ